MEAENVLTSLCSTTVNAVLGKRKTKTTLFIILASTARRSRIVVAFVPGHRISAMASGYATWYRFVTSFPRDLVPGIPQHSHSTFTSPLPCSSALFLSSQRIHPQKLLIRSCLALRERCLECATQAVASSLIQLEKVFHHSWFSVKAETLWTSETEAFLRVAAGHNRSNFAKYRNSYLHFSILMFQRSAVRSAFMLLTVLVQGSSHFAMAMYFVWLCCWNDVAARLWPKIITSFWLDAVSFLWSNTCSIALSTTRTSLEHAAIGNRQSCSVFDNGLTFSAPLVLCSRSPLCWSFEC